MNGRMTAILLSALMVFASGYAPGEDSKKAVASASPEIQAVDRVYYLRVRVIFAGRTGFLGEVIPELADMKAVLTQNFNYPSYELSNTIRLSLFGDEEATALAFPDHYLRVIPKGSTKGNRLKVKVELYYVPQGSDTRTRVTTGEPPRVVQFQTESKEGSHSELFPIAGSAMILELKQWDAFGGVPVRVGAGGTVSSNTLSSSPITQPGNNTAPGASKFLILGISLDDVRM